MDTEPAQASPLQFLKILRCIATTQFMPMGANDYAAFAGASDKALIGFTGGDLAAVISDIVGHPIPLEDKTVAIIIDGGIAELHTWTLDGGYISFSLNLGRRED